MLAGNNLNFHRNISDPAEFSPGSEEFPQAKIFRINFRWRNSDDRVSSPDPEKQPKTPTQTPL
jgi:hypothetical protein